jgi:hypothetical protein
VNSHLLSRWLGSLSLLAALLGTPGRADEAVITRERHPWAVFGQRSWKLVKVTTETFDAEGKSTGTSVTETRSTLVGVDATSYELQIDVTVEVAGKRFASPPRVTRHGLNGEGEGQTAIVRRLGETVLKVGERPFRVQNAEIEVSDKDLRKVTQLSYAGGVQPYVLSRRSVTHDAAGKLQQETIVQTKAIQVPKSVLGARRLTWETTTTQKHPGGTIVTDEVHCFDVPGGVVEHTSVERDDKDKLLRRSKLELVNYGIAAADTVAPKRFSKRKPRRSK